MFVACEMDVKVDPAFSSHRKDWCHVCGKISEPTCDINYQPLGDGCKYIRICIVCAERAARVIQESASNILEN